ncbi:site-specific integrase [Latilactobacillus sp. 5-91]|uniref:site-specific integrase n=1 Tax=Latilactobacillus sp. 5-91 TaxID=3410924 RepID=UPI003C790099
MNEVLVKHHNMNLSVEDEHGNFRRIDKKTLRRQIRSMTFYQYYVWYIENNKLNKVRDVTYEKYALTGRDIKRIAGDMLLVDLENNRISLQWILDKYGQTHRRQTWLDFKGKILQALRFAAEDGYISGFAQSGLVINTIEHTWDDKKRDDVFTKKKAFSATEFVKFKSYLDFKLDEMLDKEPVYEDKSLHINSRSKTQTIQNKLLILSIAIHTGMRFAEVLGITEDCVFDDKIKVNKTWDYKTFSGFIPTKNRASLRDVAVDQTIVGLIRRYIKFKHNFFPKADLNLPIFLECKDTVFYNDVVNSNLYTIEKKLNVERLSIHKLRHSYASYLIFQGIPETVIAKQLGHTDTNMLHRVYGHLLEEQAEAGSSKIRGLMG